MPFFYVQPPQPYLPYQWPMPMPYSPYGGFPGFGYGMVLPPFPPASYVEAPGYIVPHTQMHMVDYRRMMTPHMAPTMAYQARRFRYQHTTPSGRVMVSSEVQTELVGTDSQRNSTVSSQNTSESGRSSASGSVLLSPKLDENQLPTCPEQEAIKSSTKTAAEMSGTATSSAVPNGGILFQAEEVRIECSGSPSALKIVHSQETGELARNASGELLQCSMESAEDVVMRCFQSVQFGENDQKKCLEDLGHLDEQYLPPCPDILLMRSCPTDGATLEGSDEPASSTLLGQGDSSLVKSAEDTCVLG
ncbi:bucky ball [Trichomycterus rosablanca]|uniref:bucky ball n=1 Tax=Trichomycterus rosablanca TaxID=2290929 RepID=UPI002F35984A